MSRVLNHFQSNRAFHLVRKFLVPWFRRKYERIIVLISMVIVRFNFMFLNSAT